MYRDDLWLVVSTGGEGVEEDVIDAEEWWAGADVWSNNGAWDEGKKLERTTSSRKSSMSSADVRLADLSADDSHGFESRCLP